MQSSGRFLGLFSHAGKQMEKAEAARASAGNGWLAANPSKRWCEMFFLGYSPVWITALLCVVVPFRLYEDFDEWRYLALGVGTVAPLLTVPLIFPCEADKGKPLHQQYWVKANVWIGVFGFIGNYFYTHYFFQLLGAAYTMPSHRLNDIPIALYLITHAYFCLYHALSNLLIRKTLSVARSKSWKYPWVAAAVVIFSLAYVTAFMETFTIAHYPHYTHTNKSMMYSVGSLFYAIYFWVSFPAFFLMDEDAGKPRMPLWRAAWDALAAGMLVLIILDFWRLYIGDIAPQSGSLDSQAAPSAGLPWLSGGMA